MLYQHLKIVKRFAKYALLVVPLLVVLFFLFTASTVTTGISNFSHTLAQPIWHTKERITTGIDALIEGQRSRESLYRENEFLKTELAQLQREGFMADAAIADNVALQKMLGHSTEESGYVSAAVIHDMTLSAHDVFIIDSGVTQGIRNNMLILTPEGIAIGYVSEVLHSTAIVRGFSSPETAVDVVIAGTTTTHARLTGYGSGTMTLTVPRDILVQEHDYILLPTFSTHPIGTIASVLVTPEDAYKTAYVRSPINMHELRHVYVDTTHIWNAKDVLDEIEFSFMTAVTEEAQEEEAVTDASEE